MFNAARNRAIAHGVSRIPGIRRLPVFKLIAVGEIALLARAHASRLSVTERRRLLGLIRAARGRTRNLSAEEREELSALVAKAEPRLFAGLAADKLSPVPLPRRIVHGKKKPR